MADCSNILLSFLSDVGEDWSDSFIFPDTEVSQHMDVDQFIVKADYIQQPALNSSTSTSSIATDGSPCTTRESSLNSSASDDKEFQESLENLFDFSNDEFDVFTTEDMFGSSPAPAVTSVFDCYEGSYIDAGSFSSPSSISPGNTSNSHQMSVIKCDPVKSTVYVNVNGTKVEESMMTSQIGIKRNREESTDDPKAAKASVNQKITAVCGMLKQYSYWKKAEEEKDRRLAAKRFRYTTPIETATMYLQSLFNSKPVTPQELLKISASNSILYCKALSSLVQNSQSKKAMAKLSAWMPVGASTSTSAFPETHSGIGQIAAASRAFTSAMNDVLGHYLMCKLTFSVHIPPESAITSRFGKKLSAPFVFKSIGMISLGYPEELEFTGSINCSFIKEGIQSASVYFDACKIVRDQSRYNQVQIADVSCL